MMPFDRSGRVCLDRIIAISNISVTVNPVQAFLELNPLLVQVSACPVVSYTIAGLVEFTTEQSAIVGKGIGVARNGADTGSCCKVNRAEVIEILANRNPAGLQHTHMCIIGLAVTLNQAGVRCLTYIQAIFTEVIVQLVNYLNASQFAAIDIVSIAAILNDPAFLDGVDQGVAVFEGSVGILEVAALIRRIIGVDVITQTEGCLVLRLLREGMQCGCAHVNLVADRAGVDDIQTALGAPVCVCLGSELNAADYAQGVCGVRIDSSGLLLPVQNHGNRVSCLIDLGTGQNEELVDQLHLADIHIQIGIELDGCGDFRHGADTLCQLQQEAPSRGALHVSTGQHKGQFFQTCGDGNLGHVDCQGIVGNHLLFRINDHVGIGIFQNCIAHFTIPSQHAVAAGCLVKVEGHFALLIQSNGCSASNIGVMCQCGSNDDILDTRSLIAGGNKVKSVDGTCVLITQGDYQVACRNGNRLTLIQCLHRQGDGCTVNSVDICLGEVNLIRQHDVQGLGADDSLTGHQIDLNFTVAQADKQAVFGDGASSVVRQNPAGDLRQLSFVAGCADTLGSQLHRSADRQIVCLTLQNCMVKCSGAGSGRNDHQRCSNGTLETVGRSVDNSHFLFTGLLRNEGGRTAAVQVDCDDTTCFQHDLGDFTHITAGGEGLLSAVQNHHNDLTSLGDTNGSTARAGSIAGSNNLAILNQHSAEAGDAFCHLALIDGVVFLGGADNGSAVFQDAEESSLVNAMVLHTAHNQQAARLTGSHVKACTVGADNYIVVGDVVGAFGIAILVLRGVCLIQNTLHFPTLCGVIVVVVCVDIDIGSGNIGSSNVVNNLLTVSSGCVFDFLGDTRCQHIIGAREDIVVGGSGGFNVVATQLADVVCEGVANSLSQNIQVGGGEVSGAFQRCNHLVASVSIVHCLTDSIPGADTAQSGLQEVLCPIFIGEIFCEVCIEQCYQIALLVAILVQSGHQVQGI